MFNRLLNDLQIKTYFLAHAETCVILNSETREDFFNVNEMSNG